MEKPTPVKTLTKWAGPGHPCTLRLQGRSALLCPAHSEASVSLCPARTSQPSQATSCACHVHLGPAWAGEGPRLEETGGMLLFSL